MFGINYINGSFQWLGVPDFLRTDGPARNAIMLAPHPSCGDQGPSTNLNWVSQTGGNFDSVSIPWNRPIRVYAVYHRKIFENTCAAARRVLDDLLRANRLSCIQSPTTCRNPIRNPRGRQYYEFYDLWYDPVDQ